MYIVFPSWAVYRTYYSRPCISAWCFRFLYLALFDEFVNSYLLYPSPAPRYCYLTMTRTFFDLLEMFFHALWQLAEVDFTRISWNRPIIFARYIWVYSDQQVLVSTAFYSRYDYQKWVNLHITSWSKMQESSDDIILTSVPVAHISSKSF